MKYTLQVNTGSFTRTAVSGGDIIARLSQCLDSFDVERVIYGWSPDPAINAQVAGFLTQRHIEKYLWLPVFCEIHDPACADPFQSLSGDGQRTIEQACEGETFAFVCQSSSKNLRRAKDVYEQLAGEQQVEGVFLDRIRYASAASGIDELFGCWCPACRARYEAAGVDAARFSALSAAEKAALFVPVSQENGRFHYADETVEKLASVKRQIITEAAAELCRHFHAQGKKVGIDTFAPGIADFVGQDLPATAQLADFIKPMVYLRTTAPAGVPFELAAMSEAAQRHIGELWHAPAAGMEAAISQLEALLKAGVSLVPGIDANRIDGICSASPDYVSEYLDRLESIGCTSAVLAWDALRLSPDVLAVLKARQ